MNGSFLFSRVHRRPASLSGQTILSLRVTTPQGKLVSTGANVVRVANMPIPTAFAHVNTFRRVLAIPAVANELPKTETLTCHRGSWMLFALSSPFSVLPVSPGRRSFRGYFGLQLLLLGVLFELYAVLMAPGAWGTQTSRRSSACCGGMLLSLFGNEIFSERWNSAWSFKNMESYICNYFHLRIGISKSVLKCSVYILILNTSVNMWKV